MLTRLAGFALAPVLLVQGRRVRRDTPVLPEPPGPREGQAGAGRPLRLLILGDSAAAGVGAAHQDEALAGRLVAALAGDFALEWRLIARTGATTAGTLRRLDGEPVGRWDVVVTSLGVNDVVGRIGREAWLERQRVLVARIRELCRAQLVVLSGLPPMHGFPALPQPLRWYLGRRAREFDAGLADWARLESGVIHVPADLPDPRGLMAPDGFHPGPPGYALWAERVARAIQVHA